MKGRPEYLNPSAMPHKATKAVQLLYRIKQTAALSHSTLSETDALLTRFNELPKAEREAAEKQLEAGDLLRLSKSMIESRTIPQAIKEPK